MKLLDVVILGALIFFISGMLTGCATAPAAEAPQQTELIHPAPACSDLAELETDAFFALNDSWYDANAVKIKVRERTEEQRIQEIVKLVQRGCAN